MPTPNQQSSVSVDTMTSLPQRISLDKWADAGFTWSGEVRPESFERLNSILTDEHDQHQITIEVTLATTNNILSLSFRLKGAVWLTCQRCLHPVEVDLTGDYHIDLLENEAQVKLLHDEDEYLLLEEVVQQAEHGHEEVLPLARLIEDEILLKTPLSPKHEDCEMVVDQVGEIEESTDDNPFAALAALKGKLSS